MFDVITNLLDEVGSWFLVDIFTALMTIFTDAFIALAGNTDTLMEIDIVKNSLHLFKNVAIFVLVLNILLNLIKTYMLNLDGDADGQNPLVVIRNGTLAVLLIYNIDFIINEIYRFGTNLLNDVAVSNGASYEQVFQSGRDNLANNSTLWNAQMVPANMITFVIFGVGLLLLLLIIVFQMAIRKAELIYYQLIAPFLAVNFASPNRDMWGILIKSVVSLSVTQVLQMLMVMLSFQCLQTLSGINQLLYGLAFAWVGVKTPQALKQFIHSTGVGSSIGGVARTVAMRLPRR